MSHILINAATGAPVPLPYYTVTHRETKVTIHDFNDQRIYCSYGNLERKLWIRPGLCDLAIVTEEEFMRRQSAQDPSQAF